jgi:hypothetical protein
MRKAVGRGGLGCVRHSPRVSGRVCHKPQMQTLRTARTKASPCGGFAGVSPVDLLVSLQRELVRRTGLDPGRVEDVIIGCASQNAEQGVESVSRVPMFSDGGPLFCHPDTVRAS